MSTQPTTTAGVPRRICQFNDGGTLQAYLPGANLAAKIDNALRSDDNIHAALALFRDRGWQPWACGDA